MQTSLTQDISPPKESAVSFPIRSQAKLALCDITDGFMKWPIWLMLAYQDIKLRYRRSVLGPFWITISMAITAYSMGYLYSHLFHQDLHIYFPYLVGGMLGWSLITGNVTDITDAFTSYESMIKQIKLPYSFYIHRIVARNMIIFFHNIVVMIPIIIIFPENAKITLNTLFLFPALLIFYINSLTFGHILAMIGARFRDISQVIKSLMQVVFFVTPVMWKADILPPNKAYIALYNPFNAFLDLIRSPLIGSLPSMHSLEMVLGMTLAGIVFFYLMFKRYRTRIIYWL